MKLRQAAERIVERAAEAGMENPGDILLQTPREIELCFRSLARRRQMEWENIDLAAWLAGRYFLIALHAPRRYPRKPDGVRRRAADMSDAQMKRVFTAMAAGREEEIGDC